MAFAPSPVAAVLLYHAELAAFQGGFLGVDVFFALSGFLITRLLVSSASMAWLVWYRDYPESADASRAYFGTDTHSMGLLLGARSAGSKAEFVQPAGSVRSRLSSDLARTNVIGLLQQAPAERDAVASDGEKGLISHEKGSSYAGP